MTAAIDVRDAFRIHRSAGGTAVALQGLSLRVEEGEIVVVLGPSGAPAPGKPDNRHQTFARDRLLHE